MQNQLVLLDGSSQSVVRTLAGLVWESHFGYNLTFELMWDPYTHAIVKFTRLAAGFVLRVVNMQIYRAPLSTIVIRFVLTMIIATINQ